MTASNFVAKFSAIAAENPVDVHTLTNDRLKVLWVLGVLKDTGTDGYYRAADVVLALREGCGIELSRQFVQTILEKERSAKTVSRKLNAGTGHFKIMRSGEEEISGSRIAVRIVDPGNALDEIRELESVLGTLKGTLRVCDPYVDNKILDYMAECKSATAIRLLTVNIQESTKLRRDLAAFKTQHPIPLEIKVLAAGKLHDRYIVHNDGMLALGGSLYGFAKKQMLVFGIGTDLIGGIAKTFDAHWAQAAAF